MPHIIRPAEFHTSTGESLWPGMWVHTCGWQHPRWEPGPLRLHDRLVLDKQPIKFQRLLPNSFLGWVMLLAVLGIVYLLSLLLLLPLLVPTEWGGATQ